MQDLNLNAEQTGFKQPHELIDEYYKQYGNDYFNLIFDTDEDNFLIIKFENKKSKKINSLGIKDCAYNAIIVPHHQKQFNETISKEVINYAIKNF